VIDAPDVERVLDIVESRLSGGGMIIRVRELLRRRPLKVRRQRVPAMIGR
jgi:hypothetical protein